MDLTFFYFLVKTEVLGLIHLETYIDYPHSRRIYECNMCICGQHIFLISVRDVRTLFTYSKSLNNMNFGFKINSYYQAKLCYIQIHVIGL